MPFLLGTQGPFPGIRVKDHCAVPALVVDAHAVVGTVALDGIVYLLLEAFGPVVVAYSPFLLMFAGEEGLCPGRAAASLLGRHQVALVEAVLACVSLVELQVFVFVREPEGEN